MDNQLMNRNDQTDSLPDFDTWLRQELQHSEPYIDDDGFCEQVMASLPAPRNRRVTERRYNFLQYGAVLLSSGIVAWNFPLGAMIDQLMSQSISLYSLIAVGLLGSTIATGAGLVALKR